MLIGFICENFHNTIKFIYYLLKFRIAFLHNYRSKVINTFGSHAYSVEIKQMLA